MNDIFTQKDNNRYNLRHTSKFPLPLGPKIWDMLPDDCKDIDNLNTFKNKVKKWKPENCPCRPCKVYINNKDFV